MRIGIVGGGLGGLTLRYFLRHKNEILEKEERVGGLCRTFEKDGFFYDLGGHILYSKNKQIISFVRRVLGRNINYCRRNNKILFKGRFVKYPFENGLSELDFKDNYECLISYLKNAHTVKPDNFKEWILYTFGNGIASKYLIPYNKKIWKFKLEQMDLGWVERVPKPPLEDIVKSAIGIETQGYTHQLYFNYPKIGGIEGLIKALIKDKGPIHTGFNVSSIRKRGKSWIVSDGREEKSYDKLVLTMPVTEIIAAMEKVPQKVSKAASLLKYNSLRIVLIGIRKEKLLDKSAVYLPDSRTLAHRACYMAYFSRNNAPQGKSSLIAEISVRKGRGLYNISDAALTKKVINDFTRLNIIAKKDVLTADVKNIKYAYVIYDKEYTQNAGIVKNYLKSAGIELLGRFAEFEYINMDEVILRAMKLSKRLNA